MRNTKLEGFERLQPEETSFHSTTTEAHLSSIDPTVPISTMTSSEQKTIAQGQAIHVPTVVNTSEEKNSAQKKTQNTAPEEKKVLKSTPLPYRRYTGVPLPVKILALCLAAILFISGIAFIVYGETTQYRGSLRHGATAIARSTHDAYAATQVQLQKTASVLDTAQANIDASATAQANTIANATAAVDNATATATALTGLYTQSTSGNPVFNDSLTDSTGPGQWDQGSPSTNTGCVFANGYYDVNEATLGNLQPCIAQATSFSNFAYQVNLTINKGNKGQAGLIFRANSDATSYYFFHIDTNGYYGLDLYDGSGKASSLAQGINTAITIGVGQSNQLAVIANSDTVYLYANGQYLASVIDSTLGDGKVGLGVVDKNTPVDVKFDTAQVWSPLSSSQAGNTPTPTSTANP